MSRRLKRVVQAFEDIANLMQISGTEPHKSHAYRRAARNLARSFDAFEGQWDESRLQSIRGIGPALAAKAVDIAQTGSCDYLDRLTQKVPLSVLQLLQLPGLGVKTASTIYQELGVSSLSELQQAADSGQLMTIEGIGQRRQQQIGEAVRSLASRARAVTLDSADAHAEHLVELLKGISGTMRVHPVGQLRRRRDEITRLGLMATLCRGVDRDRWLAEAREAIGRDGTVRLVEEAGARGECNSSVCFTLGRGVGGSVCAVAVDVEGAALLHLTATKQHRRRLVELSGDEALGGFTAWCRRFRGMCEGEIYADLGLQFIPPELRRADGELSCARRGKLPELLQRGDLKGDLHCHTSWSDGAAGIEEMVEAARQRGLTYLAVTDHSHSLTVAGGLNAAELLRQTEIIDKLAEKLEDFRLLKGIEVDILPDGSLDLTDDVLRRLDVVIASIHSGLNLGTEKMTERLLSAAEHPMVNIMGHPTGRLLGVREPEPPDLEKLLQVCQKTGTAIEINSSPDRLDLPWQWVKKAVDMGVRLVISSDAHSPSGFDLLDYGVDCARRGWCEAVHILNTRNVTDLVAVLNGGSEKE